MLRKYNGASQNCRRIEKLKIFLLRTMSIFIGIKMSKIMAHRSNLTRRCNELDYFSKVYISYKRVLF